MPSLLASPSQGSRQPPSAHSSAGSGPPGPVAAGRSLGVERTGRRSARTIACTAVPIGLLLANVHQRSGQPGRAEAELINCADAICVSCPEEEAQFEEARRFARLLISEIKLYNESQVDEGRQHSDLYQRLSRDIDRSREMYEKRAHASVRVAADHFHEELVRILAKGEEGLLGKDYPGPLVKNS